MEKYTLIAAKRKVVGRKVKHLRSDGFIPANLYGKKIKSEAIQVNEKEFLPIFAKAGETSLIELIVDGNKRPVLIHNVQYHPVSNLPLHIDFFQVDLKEKVSAKVNLAFTGEAKAVKDKVGVLLTILSDVEVEALPADLPEKIEVDVSKLSEVGSSIKVVDLQISDKIKILASADAEVVKVAPLISKEAEKMAKEEAEAAAAAASAVPSETKAGAVPVSDAATKVDSTAEKKPATSEDTKKG